MFTGIIGGMGKVAAARKEGGGVHLTVEAPATARELRIDDSVSINGVCQTVTACDAARFTVTAVEETLQKTTLGTLRTGDSVNLELAVRLNDRLGGHLVQGHVDCVGTINEVEVLQTSWRLGIDFPSPFARYVVPIGSIAVDGISLTVADVTANRFHVAIIPHTLEKTTLSGARRGLPVNLEFDILGKYIERLLLGGKAPGKEGEITPDLLGSWGYKT
jgi:riboflavin synthase